MWLALALPAFGDETPRVLRVGPGQALAAPSAAAAVARDGDRIEIAAGRYAGDVAIWRANRLDIVGFGGRPLLDAAGAELAQIKAIWVIQGDDVRVDNVEFAHARSPDRNGGGIRSEGRGLSVSRCVFRNSETGLLAGGPADSDILVEQSVFAYNGHADGQAHNIYVGRVRSFTLRGSHVHHAVTGSQVKSRALVTRILYNRIEDGTDGAGNYLIDVSNGGLTDIVGNVLHQGMGTENRTLVAFAPEGTDGRPQDLRVVHNTFVNDLPYGRFIANRTGVSALILNNLFVGPGIVVSGPARLQGNVLEQSWPWTWWLAPDGVRRVTGPSLLDVSAGDYGLRPEAEAVDAGMALTGDRVEPVRWQYRHPAGEGPRRGDARPDAGAYEALR